MKISSPKQHTAAELRATVRSAYENIGHHIDALNRATTQSEKGSDPMQKLDAARVALGQWLAMLKE